MPPARPPDRDWSRLSAGSRRRWVAAYGGPRSENSRAEREANARAAYESGSHLTVSQRGHRYTPNRPEDALRHPERYPRYLAKPENLRLVNELARIEGERRDLGPTIVGRGKKGSKADEQRAREGVRDPGAYTYVVPAAEFAAGPDEWRGSTKFTTAAQAQREARRSGMPPGAVVIVYTPRPADWPKGQDFYGYRLWYDRDVSPKGKKAA